MTRITNINGTSDTICRCGSWLDHWINYNGGQSKPLICPVINCFESGLIGAHVQKADSQDRNWYIVPLCKKHNKSKTDLEILDSINFVNANKKETCER